MTPPFSILRDCQIHDTVRIIGWANLYGCTIHEKAFIGPFVEIGRGAIIGERTRISSHSYICDGTHIGADCFIAHGVLTCNDDFSHPETYQYIDELSAEWEFKRLTIGNSVRIGSGAVLLPVNIGDHAVIGAGAVVCEDVPAGAVVKGVPAREKATKGQQ
jgi:acetyltransferase-like isoleucine patch superfamily enzyme